jgi:hypothetical protein
MARFVYTQGKFLLYAIFLASVCLVFSGSVKHVKAQSYLPGGVYIGSLTVNGTSISVTGGGGGGTEVDDAWCPPGSHYSTAPVRPTAIGGPSYSIDSGAGGSGSYTLQLVDPGRTAFCDSPSDWFQPKTYTIPQFSVASLSAGSHRLDLCVNDAGDGNPQCDSATFQIGGGGGGTTPSVDIKANGSDGPINVSAGTTVTIDWSYANIGGTHCTVSPGPGQVGNGASGSGSYTYQVTQTTVFDITECPFPPPGFGTLYDSVTVNVTGDFGISCSPVTQSIQAGSGTAIVATITPGQGFTNPVDIQALRTIDASPNPPSWTAASPGTISSPYTQGSSISISTDVNTTQTTYHWAFEGTSGSIFHEADCDVTVTAVTGNFTLNVGKVGSGGGTVTSNPVGINCGFSCSANYSAGTLVTLSAAANGTSTFAGWAGDADCTDGQVTMNVNVNCTAQFDSQGVTTYTLTVTFAGTGSGTVTSSPPGISCNSTCSASFSSGTTVTLTESPGGSSTFSSWSGGSGNGNCTGSASTCIVTLSQNSGITATFNANNTFVLSYLKKGAGTGTVYFNPAGSVDNCAGNCNITYAAGTVVTVFASAGSGSVFAGWGTDCSGTGNCVVTMSANHAIQATFNVAASFLVTVTEAGTGSGVVTSSPSGINCDNSKSGSVCSASFASGSTVTLTATPNANSTFTAWSGDCVGSGGCSLSMTKARAVTATFGPSCPAGSVNLGVPTIDVTKTTTASAPAGFSGGSFVSSDTTKATVSGTTITGVEGGTSSITGTGWSYTNGATGCALAGSTITVRDFTVSASASPSSIQAGTNSNITVTVGAVNSGTMTVTVTAPAGLPSGWSINPPSWSGPAGTQTVFVVTTTTGATQTTQSLGFTGTAYAVHSHNGSTNLTVTAPPPNPPTGVTLDNSVSCGTIRVSWTPPVGGTAPTGYNVYRSPNGSAPWTKIGNNVAASPYTDATPLGGLNYYYVTAINGALESVAAYPSPPATAALACTLNSTTSDKDIMQINSTANLPGGTTPSQCSSGTELAASVNRFVAGDKITWRVSYCNSGNGTVSNPSITDTLTNLTLVNANPAAWTYSGCSYVSSSFSGPKQFTVTVSSIAAAPPTKICSITYDTTIDSSGSASLSNFKNKVDFNNSGVLQSSYTAGPFLYNTSLSNPTKKETP